MTRIYLVQNEVNGKVYVGKTTGQVVDRWMKHVHSSSEKRRPFQCAIQKHGKNSFSVYEIDGSDDDAIGDLLEIFYIDVFRSCERDFGYNLTLGGEGGKWSEQARLRRKESPRRSPSGWRVSGKRRKRLKVSDEEIINFYQSCGSLSATGRHFGVSWGLVKRRLLDNGISPQFTQSHQSPQSPKFPAEIIRQYQLGAKISDLAEQVGITAPSLRVKLSKLGVKRIPRGFRGVYLHKPSASWYAHLSVGGKPTDIGYYSNPEDAARAYDLAAIEIYGERAITNESLGLLSAV